MPMIETPVFVAHMPVPRCDACAWWRPFAADLQPAVIGGIIERLAEQGFSDLLASVDLQQLGDCRLFECRNKEQVEPSSKIIITRTGTGEATIVTTADFGCVQFKEVRRSHQVHVTTEACTICMSSNPWHHPYTIHCAWCPHYDDEPLAARNANRVFSASGGFYGQAEWPTAEQVLAVRSDGFRGYGLDA